MRPALRRSTFLARLAGHCLALILLLPLAARADGVFVPAAQPTDVVYDEQRDLLFISSGAQLLRYQVASGAFLAPLELGGALAGLDLSPDGNTLAVADTSFDAAGRTNWIHLVDLGGPVARKVTFAVDGSEAGTHAVAWGRDGRLLVTSACVTSCTAPLRRYDPASNTVARLDWVAGNTVLSASPDRSMVAFAETSVLGGRIGRYRVSDGSLLRQFQPGYRFGIAAATGGLQYAVTTYSATGISDATMANWLASIGAPTGSRPLGAAYHPGRNRIYFSWTGTSTVQVYDTTTWQAVGAHDTGYVFQPNVGNSTYGPGRVRLSRSGTWLVVVVDGGVRLIPTDNQVPVALPRSVIVPEDQPRTISVAATDADGDALAYELVSAPRHGSLQGVAPDWVYVPSQDFNGQDSFSFLARDAAGASLPAQVDITVFPVNDAPSFVSNLPALVSASDARRVVMPQAFVQIKAGPPDEAGQWLGFDVYADNEGLFLEKPRVTSDGTLTFKAVPGRKGSTNVTVWLRDDGGIDNGATGVSAPYIFGIYVEP